MDLEKLQQEILDLREKNKELSTELENIKNDNELKSERIKSLGDYAKLLSDEEIEQLNEIMEEI